MLKAMRLRIGTWNIEGRWSDEHRHLLVWQQCDVWLLPEVSEKTKLPGYVLHPSRASIREGCSLGCHRCAGEHERAIHSDPHPASCMVTWSGVTFTSSVLPWNSSAASWPGPGKGTLERTRVALDELARSLSTNRDPEAGTDDRVRVKRPAGGHPTGARSQESAYPQPGAAAGSPPKSSS